MKFIIIITGLLTLAYMNCFGAIRTDTISDMSGENIINVDDIAKQSDVDKQISEMVFNTITNVSGTTINISTNQLSYKISITDDTAFVFDNSISNVTCAVSIKLDFDTVYDIDWGDAHLVRNIEYAENSVYNFSGFFDGEDWYVIAISKKDK